MSQLKDHHLTLLRRLIEQGSIPVNQVDRRMLRPLRSLALVAVSAGFVTPTAAARQHLSERTSGSGGEQAGPPRETRATGLVTKLTRAQEDLLRLIATRRGVPVHETDGRTREALRTRGLIRQEGELLYVSDRGAALLSRPRVDEGQIRRGPRPVRSPRAEAILKAADQLEHVIPPEAEVLVGNILAAALDVTSGFRALARRKQDEEREKLKRPRG